MLFLVTVLVITSSCRDAASHIDRSVYYLDSGSTTATESRGLLSKGDLVF